MKGCVQGYGNYEELTSSGVDPTELFDDIEDSIKSPDFVQPDEECNDIIEEESDQQDIKGPDHIHPLPIEKPREYVRSESSNFDRIRSLSLSIEKPRKPLRSRYSMGDISFNLKPRKRNSSRYSESDTGSNFDPVFDDWSIYVTPPVVSIPDDFDKNNKNKVRV